MTVQATDTDDDTEYREDVFKVTNMRFLDANGNEATEYVEGDTARLEVTLANNSDSDLELIENGMWLKLYSGDIYDYDGGGKSDKRLSVTVFTEVEFQIRQQDSNGFKKQYNIEEDYKVDIKENLLCTNPYL